MNYFELKFSLDSGLNQSEVMQQLQSSGDKVIQTSSGLCVGTQRSEEQVNKMLKSKNFSQMQVRPISAESQQTPDVQAFMNS